VNSPQIDDLQAVIDGIDPVVLDGFEKATVRLLSAVPVPARLGVAEQLGREIVALQEKANAFRFYRMFCPEAAAQLMRLDEALDGAIAAGDRQEIQRLRFQIADLHAKYFEPELFD
jgi:hypothetical protein